MEDVTLSFMGDPKNTYPSTIESLKGSHPHLTDVLTRAHRNRTDRLSERARGARLEGLDEWLAYLHELEKAFCAEPSLAELAFLIGRICADYETAIEAALSGLHSVVFDTMRDVMEIWMLLRDFAYDPARISIWLAASDRELLDEFSPKALRRRNASRLGVEPKDLQETADYRGHSRSLHVSPKSLPWERRGIVPPSTDQFMVDMCYWELFSHAESIAVVVRELTARLAPGKRVGRDAATELPCVAKAYERVEEMKSIFFGLLKAAGGASDET